MTEPRQLTVVRCTGCGTSRPIEELKALGFLSCCPERSMRASILCDTDGQPCFLPECAEHGCMCRAWLHGPSMAAWAEHGCMGRDGHGEITPQETKP